jgi:hypothetical protein
MKLIDAFVKRTTRTIRQFGQASLVRHTDGRYELIGGATCDLVAAKEWVSLFAHEIVFDQSTRRPKPRCHAGRHRIPSVFKQQRAGFLVVKRSPRIQFWREMAN